MLNHLDFSRCLPGELVHIWYLMSGPLSTVSVTKPALTTALKPLVFKSKTVFLENMILQIT